MKIGFSLRGAYNSEVEYDILDVVVADNGLYISLKAGNVGNAVTDNEWWQEAVEVSSIPIETVEGMK